MTPFEHGRDELQHELPWLLMQNGPVTKYWRRRLFEADLAEMRERGFTEVRFDAATWADDDAMFRSFRERFALPEYFGMKFDALADSLEDIEVPSSSGLVIALDNLVKSPTSDTLLRVLGRASRRWLLFGRLVIVVLRTDDAQYNGPGNVDGADAQWNRHEWLQDRRSP